jgi:hypothetical protein
VVPAGRPTRFSGCTAAAESIAMSFLQ